MAFRYNGDYHLYIIMKEDFYKLKTPIHYTVAHIGTDAITFWLCKEDVFALWCEGVVAEPVDSKPHGVKIKI